MIYSVPDYYKEFHCIADACEDTCCAGWQIVVDKKSLKQYKHVTGAFRKRMQKGVNWRNETFRQDKEKRCAFLNDNNLCDMYIALGANSLCRTCRLYPRHIEEFEGVREITLSISCPEAARILMNRTEPVSLRSVERDGEEEFEDFDLFLYSELLDAREVIRGILQKRELPIDVRAGLVYGLARDVQRRINRQELFSCGEVFGKYQKSSAEKFVREKIEENKKNPSKTFHFKQEQFRKLHKLELLKKDWEFFLLEAEQKLFLNHSAKEYQEISEAFCRWYREQKFPWEIQKEQLLVYFIDTYFCGAVYDGEVLAKAQMALICTDMIEDLLKTRWLGNEKSLDMEDVIEVVYRFSREVEHSDRNLKRMEAMMPGENEMFC